MYTFYNSKGKIKLSYYILLGVSSVTNVEGYIMFILPKQRKQNSF